MLGGFDLWLALQPASREDGAEIGRYMAAFTLQAKLAAVHIIIFVATCACSMNNEAVGHFFFVASIAVRLLVAAIELEFGAFIMVKVPCLPRTRVVA